MSVFYGRESLSKDGARRVCVCHSLCFFPLCPILLHEEYSNEINVCTYAVSKVGPSVCLSVCLSLTVEENGRVCSDLLRLAYTLFFLCSESSNGGK